jgi:hypothetical protein
MVQSDEERKIARKKAQKKYSLSVKAKARTAKYNATPKSKIRTKKFQLSEKGKALQKRYNLSEKGRSRQKKYAPTDKSKARSKKYESTEKGKTKRKKREQSPKYKSTKKETRNDKRLDILLFYSKRLSDSNIPCCNCCGENSHTDFLAVDHIAGKKQMDSESELVKLGYSSSKRGSTLHKWIKDNNFPYGFQILCHNCNQAKGYYGICPHEKARKEEIFAMMEEQSRFETGFQKRNRRVK